ncbi:MAG: GNAT family N-acetyltransferase [Anaerolineae bacterium]|nr:GNAT family N-acetyltransferase [Anaerolineae bacterium]
MITIREFTGSDADFEAMLAIKNTVYPFMRDSVPRWQHMYHDHPDQIIFRWYMVEHDGRPIGTGGYDQSIRSYDAHHFVLGAEILPDFQGCGYGKALYEHIMDDLQAYAPRQLITRTRQDITRAMRFVLDRSFAPEQWDYEQRLNPQLFDATPFADLETKLAARGIVVRTLRELHTDPQRDCKLYALFEQVAADVPTVGEPTGRPFTAWRDRLFNNPTFLPDGYFVAVHGDDYVGFTQITEGLGNPWEYYQGLTGVLRHYRRRGIALALKVCAIEFAKRNGKTQIKTFNARQNVGMLRINELVGFKRQPPWITLVKRMTAER